MKIFYEQTFSTIRIFYERTLFETDMFYERFINSSGHPVSALWIRERRDRWCQGCSSAAAGKCPNGAFYGESPRRSMTAYPDGGRVIRLMPVFNVCNGTLFPNVSNAAADRIACRSLKQRRIHGKNNSQLIHSGCSLETHAA